MQRGNNLRPTAFERPVENARRQQYSCIISLSAFNWTSEQLVTYKSYIYYLTQQFPDTVTHISSNFLR